MQEASNASQVTPAAARQLFDSNDENEAPNEVNEVSNWLLGKVPHMSKKWVAEYSKGLVANGYDCAPMLESYLWEHNKENAMLKDVIKMMPAHEFALLKAIQPANTTGGLS